MENRNNESKNQKQSSGASQNKSGRTASNPSDSHQSGGVKNCNYKAGNNTTDCNYEAQNGGSNAKANGGSNAKANGGSNAKANGGSNAKANNGGSQAKTTTGNVKNSGKSSDDCGCGSCPVKKK